jgi:hypothetical protein
MDFGIAWTFDRLTMMQQQTSANTHATINKEKILRSELAVHSYQLQLLLDTIVSSTILFLFLLCFVF